MSQLVAQLVTAAVVGALSPVATMATITVLAAADGNRLRNAIGLLCGWTLLLVGLGALGLAVFEGAGPALSDSTKAVLNTIVGILLLSFGLRNLLGDQHPLQAATEVGAPPPTAVGGSPTAVEANEPAPPSPSPDAPHWMQALDTLTLLKAIGVGAVLLAVSPADLAVYLSALQGVAGRSVASAVLITALLVVAIDLCILVPLAVYIAMPGRADGLLRTGRSWLIANQRRLVAWVGAVFGLILLVTGITHLS